MKVDFLWVMGVWKVGQFGINHDRTKQSLLDEYKSYLPDFTLEDAIGCPYAVVEYDCNLELCPNGNDDLLSLKSKLNLHNIKLMLDLGLDDVLEIRIRLNSLLPDSRASIIAFLP